MKKFLLTFLCALFCICGIAQSEKTYTEPLVVVVDGESSEPQDASVTVVNNDDGTINFVLKNFILSMDDSNMPVGNIAVENMPVTKGEDGLDHISYSGNIFIQPGDLEGVDEWYGPMISALITDENGNPTGIPVVLSGKMNDEKLFVTIDIELAGQVIHVQLGTDDFTTGKVYTEPLVVTVDGESSEPQDATVTVVSNDDGTINFVLKNFILSMGDSNMPVGNIVVENLPVTKGEDGLDYISYNGNIFIQPGDLAGVDEWYGPMISSLITDEDGNPTGIPVVLSGKMNDEKLFVTIDIELAGQVIHVQLGTDDFITTKVGDVNADGDITIADGVAVLNAMAGEEVPGNADVNNDGDITIADFVAVLNLMAEQ